MSRRFGDVPRMTKPGVRAFSSVPTKPSVETLASRTVEVSSSASYTSASATPVEAVPAAEMRTL